MSFEADQFLKFLQADNFAKNKMAPHLRKIYQDYEEKLHWALSAAGGITLSAEEEETIKGRVAAQVPGIKEARAAYMTALEEWDEANSTSV